MKPTLSNLKKLILENCTGKNCKMLQFNEGRSFCDRRCRHIDYKNGILCDILLNKFKEWNSLFFPDRPCDKCLVRSMCIDNETHMTSKIANCDLFVEYKDGLLSRYQKENAQVLMPELMWYDVYIVHFLDYHWFGHF